MQSDAAIVQRGLNLVDVLGVGGNSIVYRAHDPRHGRDVAVKVLRSDAASEAADARFEREVRVAGGLRHPNILPLFDSGVLADGRRFAVMPIAQGRPLRAMIDEGPLTVADAVRLATETGEALTYLHERGWIHRDVKPENILVENGHAVLTDFGIATPIHTPVAKGPSGTVSLPITFDSVIGSRLTEFGNVIGTPAYMSPEALVADGHLDGRADVFSLGLVLYEMLAGRLPPGSHRVTPDAPRRAVDSLTERRPDVPRELDALVVHATAPDLESRLASAREFTEALGSLGVTNRRAASLRTAIRDSSGWMLVTGLAIALAAGAFAAYARHAMLPDPGRVVVADFANETGLPSLDRVGEQAGDIVSAGLSRAPGLTVINAEVALGARQRSPSARADSALIRATLGLVRDTHAGVVVTGSYFAEGAQLDVLAEVMDTRSGRILGVVGPVAIDTTRADRVLQVIADSVVGVVRHRFAPPG